MLDPDEAVAFGEDSDINWFGHGFVLVRRHPHDEGRKTDEGFRHLREVLPRQGRHGRHEWPVALRDLVPDVTFKRSLELVGPIGVWTIPPPAGTHAAASVRRRRLALTSAPGEFR